MYDNIKINGEEHSIYINSTNETYMLELKEKDNLSIEEAKSIIEKQYNITIKHYYKNSEYDIGMLKEPKRDYYIFSIKLK